VGSQTEQGLQTYQLNGVEAFFEFVRLYVEGTSLRLRKRIQVDNTPGKRKAAEGR